MTVRAVSSNPTSPFYNANAPALSGSAGALLTVLDAVLVNGFTGFTALGWTIAYTTTNKRQYAMAASGTSCQLYIDDTGPGAGGAREARINGFKTGTAIGAGTGQFPTTAQMTAPSGAVVVRKSTTADATARYYTIVGDGHTIYMFVETGDQTSPFCTYAWMFGDFFSYSASDTNNCAIIGRTIENSAALGVSGSPSGSLSSSSYYDTYGLMPYPNSSLLSSTCVGHFVCANYTGVGGSVLNGKHSDQTKMCHGNTSAYPIGLGYLGSPSNGNSGSGAIWNSAFPYPNPPDQGLYIAPIWIHHGGIIRGYYKGLWCPVQHLPLNHNDTYSATGNLSGKSMLAQAILGASNWSSSAPVITPFQVHIETSDTWS